MFGKIKQSISNQTSIGLGIVGIFVLCMIYEILAYNQHKYNPKDTTIPTINQMANGFVQSCTPRENTLRSAFGVEEEKTVWMSGVKSTWIYQDVCATYSRLFRSLFWGCLLSSLLGILMGCYPLVASFFAPLLSFLSKVPGTAMLAVFFVLASTGELMFTAMITFGILPTLTQSIYLNAKNDIHEEEINKAYTLGASNFEVIWSVVFPQILPRIIENIRLQIGPAMVYLIAAEMLVGQVGMGYQIRVQQRLSNMSVVYDYIIILGVSGLIMDRLITKIRSWLCPWND